MNNKKKILVVGMLTVIGIGTTVALIQMPKTKSERQRRHVRQFVASHTGNNQKMVDTVDRLSDKHIEDLSRLIDQVKRIQSNIYIAGTNSRDLTKAIIDKVAESLNMK